MGSRAVIYSWGFSCIILLLALHPKHTKAGLTKRSNRLAREIYPEIEPSNDGNQAQVCFVGDVVYAAGESVPAEQPCLKCKCQPPGVHCETVRCAKKTRCKAIHRPNKCCPDYQCECFHEDKIYANGERLNTSLGSECKVCYCRGGEIQCAQVSCYVRTDCEAKTVPGQCCPKYDHCPPIKSYDGPIPVVSNDTDKEVPTTTTSFQDINKVDNQNTVTADNDLREKITIQEIIPETKEVPVVEKDKNSTSTNDLIVTDTEPDSSEISEVFQHPPSVLRIGDKLLFLKQGELVNEKDVSSPTSIITIIGAEGLQRGVEESAELHDVSNNSQSLFNNSNDLDPQTAESTHILSLVKPKIKTTESPTESTTTVHSGFGDVEIYTESELEAETDLVKASTSFDKNNTDLTEPTYDTLLKESPTYLPDVATKSDNQTFQPSTKKEDLSITTPPSEESTTNINVSQEESVTFSTNYRSMESIEEEESGENTTPTDGHASIISTENASVESVENTESGDMTKPSSTPHTETTQHTTNPFKEEVEIINTTVLPEKTVVKRENSLQDEGDDVFKQLEAELNSDNTERVQTEVEEKKESDKIFKELLDETSTPKTGKQNVKDENLQKLTDTIAKLTLKEKRNSLDGPNVLGLISNLFSQSRLNGKK